MSWIDDVRDELSALDGSPRGLRRFAAVLGGALALLGAWLALRRHAVGAGMIVAGAGLLLLAVGAARPLAVRGLHRAWMAGALTMGWVTSRVVLSVLFCVAIVPIGLVGRLAGKRFLERDPDPASATYWTRRPAARKADYEKMY